MTFGSLFAGIGGIDLGLERAGMVCKWQVEIDDYATKVLEKHWPNVPRYRDITEWKPDDSHRVDVIAGGFPCQDLSYAGKREGIDGARSGLWSEYARIVRVLRPRFVFVENVSGLLSGGLGRVLSDLAECGYDAEWQVLSAAQFGAPHKRARVWLVANSDDEAKPKRAKHGEERSRVPKPCRNNQWRASERPVDGVAHGVPCRAHRIRGLGNAVVPQCAEYVGRLIMEANA